VSEHRGALGYPFGSAMCSCVWTWAASSPGHLGIALTMPLPLCMLRRGVIVSMEGGRDGNAADPEFVQVTTPLNSVVLIYRTRRPAGGSRSLIIYGAFGDRYTSADGNGPLVLGVVHVPGGPRESPQSGDNAVDTDAVTNDMLLPFPFD